MKKPFLTSSAEFTGDVSIGGNLTVTGTTTSIDTTNLQIEDKNIVLAKSSSPTNAAADGGGITLQASTDKTIIWDATNDSWGLNCNLEVSGDINFTGNLNQNGAAFSSGDPAIWSGDGASDISYSNGNVGIGTASPTATLHVKGLFGAPDTTGSSANGIARFGQVAGVGVLDVGFGNPYSWLQSRASSDYSVNYDLALQPNGGNVGIGTTNPEASFVVSEGSIGIEMGYSSGAAVNYIQSYDRGSSAFTKLSLNNSITIDSGGSVGIGTTNPSETLEVKTEATGGSALERTAKIDGISILTTKSGSAPYSGFGGALVFNNLTYTNGAVYPSARVCGGIGDNSSLTDIGGHLAFHTSDTKTADPTEKVRITAGGSVGIGTTDPSADLEIKGGSEPLTIYDANDEKKLRVFTSTTGTVLALTDGGQDIIRLDGRVSTPNSSFFNGGNVGIGTADPYFKLSVRAGAAGDSPVAACFSINDGSLSDQQEVSIGFGQEDYTFSKIAGYYDTAGTGMGLKMYAGDDLSGSTRDRSNSNPSLTIKPNGNVGIGTSSPNRDLEVQQTSGNPAISIIGDPANTIDRATIGFNYGTGTGFIAGSGLGSQEKDFYIHSVYAGVTRFYINSEGSIATATDAGKPPLKINYGDGSFYRHLGVVGQTAGGFSGHWSNTGNGAYQHIRIRDNWNSSAMFSIRVRGFLPYSVLMDNTVGMYRYNNSAQRATPLNVTYLNQGSGPNPQSNAFPGNNGSIHSIYNTSADPGYLVVVVVWASTYKGFSVECYSEGTQYGSYVNDNIEIIDVKRSTSPTPITTW